MSDELTSYLLSSGKRTALTPERLEMLGKEAASKLWNDGVPLNSTIRKTLSEFDDVNAEQVKRIVEFANQSAYLAQHDKFKVAGSDSSYPQFELADSARILQDITMSGQPSRATSFDVAYASSPQKPKIASVDVDAELATMFSYSKEKTASEQTPEGSVEEVMGTKQMLVDLRDNLARSGERFDLLLKEAQDQYYDLAKTHLLEGGSFVDILAAARSTAVGDAKIASVMRPVVEQLIGEHVARPTTLMESVRDLEKIAHRVVNQEHPFVTTFGAIVSLQTEVEKTAAGLDEVNGQLQTINSFIKEHYFASAR